MHNNYDKYINSINVSLYIPIVWTVKNVSQFFINLQCSFSMRTSAAYGQLHTSKMLSLQI